LSSGKKSTSLSIFYLRSFACGKTSLLFGNSGIHAAAGSHKYFKAGMAKP
jgi:hypothetical protein